MLRKCFPGERAEWNIMIIIIIIIIIVFEKPPWGKSTKYVMLCYDQRLSNSFWCPTFKHLLFP